MVTKKRCDLFILQSSLEGGGAERIGVELMTSMPESVKRLLVVIKGTNTPCYLPNTTQIHYLSQPHRLRNFAYIIFPFVIIRYFGLVIKYRPKIVLSILPLDNVINLCLSSIFKIKPLISAHGIRSYSGSSILTRSLVKLEQLLLRYTNGELIAVTSAVKDDVIENFRIPGKKIHVLYNPIDTKKIATLALEPVTDIQIRSDVKRIVTVGRLTDVKGQWHLIRVFSELSKVFSVELLIIGEGIERKYLEELVDNCGIRDKVSFLGWKENPYKYVARSNLFVLTSLSESFGNVLVEAMAVGCPVISSRCSDGVVEIIGSDNYYGIVTEKMSGIRYAANEPLDCGERELLNAIVNTLSDTELCDLLSSRGKERADFFGREKGISAYTALIRRYL